MPIGLDWMFADSRFDVFAEIVPTLDVAPDLLDCLVRRACCAAQFDDRHRPDTRNVAFHDESPELLHGLLLVELRMGTIFNKRRAGTR